MALNDELFRTTLNELSMRMLVLDIAVNELARAVPREQAAEIADRFRKRVADAMHDRAGTLEASADEAMTLATASFLEALGKPPKR